MKASSSTAGAGAAAYDGMDSRSAAAVMQAAADIALVIDAGGIIRDVLVGIGAPPIGETRKWLGREWVQVVTAQSRPKVREMMQEVAASGVSSTRQVDHPSAAGPEVPVSYTAVRLGPSGNFVALGRDSRALAQLRQGLIEAQQAMERDYRRMRQAETRYRLLLQLSAEALLLVDAASRKIMDANPAAGRLFDIPVKRLVGKSFPIELDRASGRALKQLLTRIGGSGRADDIRVRLTNRGRDCVLGATLVREDAGAFFLVRMAPAGRGQAADFAGGSRLLDAVEAAPDAFVLADGAGRILRANRAFLDLAELVSEEPARGRSLDRWLGRPGADFGVLLATLEEHGAARLFTTSMRGEHGAGAEVEVSAVLVSAGAESCIGLTIRDVGRRIASAPQGVRDLTAAVEQLTGLVGRVALGDLVRDTIDLVERHFIEAALKVTDDNRTAAAAMLGVSRQSLYVKLRRYQLDSDDSAESPDPAAPARR